MNKLTTDERVTIARNAEGMDILHSVLHYLHFAWGIDTPPDAMQANLDARLVLIRCKMELYNEQG